MGKTSEMQIEINDLKDRLANVESKVIMLGQALSASIIDAGNKLIEAGDELEEDVVGFYEEEGEEEVELDVGEDEEGEAVPEAEGLRLLPLLEEGDGADDSGGGGSGPGDDGPPVKAVRAETSPH